VPRFQPTSMPSTTPSTKDISVAIPTRTTVQGSDPAMTSETGVG
jgi:hypothetical protein